MRLLPVIGLFLVLGMNCAPESPPGEYTYTLTGQVPDAEGVQLALVPERSERGDRQVTVIENGTFCFTGRAERIGVAMLLFEEDIRREKLSYNFLQILLEPGEINLEVAIETQEDYTRFMHPKFLAGKKNQERVAFFRAYQGAVGTGAIVFGDSIKRDSMVRLVYPATRDRALRVFENQFATGSPEVSAVLLEQIILNQLPTFGIFGEDLLTPADEKRIYALFDQIDPVGVDSARYALMQGLIDRMNADASATVYFVDFTAVDRQGKEVRAESLIRERKFILLYFWFSACRPCREFNRELVEVYPQLAERGIEVVAVNTDDYRAKWLRSSETDKIFWPNLFLGNGTDVEIRYGISGYPFKLLFAQDLSPIDGKISSPADLLTWSATD